MIFKNLSIFRLTKPVEQSLDELNELLAAGEFEPCHPSQVKSVGWFQPLGKDAEMFTHTIGNYTMLCQRTEEKILPPAAVRQACEKKVDELEKQQNRKLSRKEKSQIKDEVVFDLIPKALSKITHIYAYFDFDKGLFIVDTASKNKAEQLINHVRETLGSFPVVPLSCKSKPCMAMADWLQKRECKHFSIGTDCELYSPCDGNKAKFSHHDLGDESVTGLVDSGMLAKSLRLNFGDEASFTLTETLEVKQLQLNDDLIFADECETPQEVFDSELVIMTRTVSQLIDQIALAFDGLADIGNAEEQLEMTGMHQNKEDVKHDPLYDEAVYFVKDTGRASTSGIQRKFRIGFNRAFRLIERMEKEGVISSISGDGQRQVLA